MQSVSFRIWTRVAVSYDDNHYTTGTSTILLYPKYLGTTKYNQKQNKKTKKQKTNKQLNIF